MNASFKRRLWLMVSFILFTMLVLTGCSGGESAQTDSQEGNDSESEEITVLLPKEIPQEILDDFESETGITVNLETLAWDQIHDRIVSSSAANVAPADVTEIDWSWAGQFGAADWFEPLGDSIDQSMIEDIPTLEIFKYNDEYIGVPYFNDFRVTYVNEVYYEQAGLEEMPETIEELSQAAQTIKEEDVMEYPIGFPLSATEGTSTGWYTMVKAFGGDLFDENWNPLFVSEDSAGYQAMEFIMDGIREEGVIDPASVSLTNGDVYDRFQAGDSAIDLAGVPGLFVRYQNPDESEVAGDVQMIPVPTQDGDIRTFGLPEALGVPKASENKEAAMEFINWITKPENVKRTYNELGWFPVRTSVMEELNEAGELPGGDTVLEVMPHVEPLFPKGTPEWYSEFSTSVSTTMNQMATGELTVEEGMEKIAASTEEYIE